MAGTPRIAKSGPRRELSQFSVCLEDNFSMDGSEHPFCPPFLTRTFELHFVKPPKPSARSEERASRPTLTWKLGDKVDYWRPTEEVLETWKEATGPDSDLEIRFIE